MIRLTFPGAARTPGDHYEVERAEDGPPITIGPSGTAADLWCGDYQWVSAVAAKLVHDRYHWWLLNPRGKTAVRFISDDGTLDLTVAAGGKAPLPAASGRLWITHDGHGQVVVRIERDPEPLEHVDAAMIAVPPPKGTVPIRPQDPRTVDLLAIATWHRRHATGYRLLTQKEVAKHVGLSEKTVQVAIREYRDWLEERHYFVFSGTSMPEEVCNIVLDNHLITAFDDEQVVASYGEPPVPGPEDDA